MTGSPSLRVAVDGRAATMEELWWQVYSGYGHFTAMQVRAHRTRGLDLHLARLAGATREMFGVGLDGERVCDHIRHALADTTGDASVRVNVFQLPSADDVSVMVTVRPPAAEPAGPQRLRTAAYQRPVAHLKHLGVFGQGHHARLAQRDGFDDVLLVGPGGVVAEGASTNIGFVDGDAVVWPDAPALAGITMLVLQRELAGAGLPWRHSRVYVADVASFDATFVTNSRGIAPVAQLDDRALPTGSPLVATLVRLYAAAAWDRI
jgi:branched-subunit amino acid aminotransferase/4-amino-4-deoxychorismate lyase